MSAITPLSTVSPMEKMQAQLDISRLAWQQQRPTVAQRRADLLRLGKSLQRYSDQLVAAIAEDFGHRPFAESMLGDIIQVQEEIKHSRAHLRAWTKRRHVSVGWKFWPAQAWLQYQPLGVVGIVSPWNYPLMLMLVPMVSALAAGNHVLLKPSEYTPATNEVLRALLTEVFPAEKVDMITGGPEVSAAFTRLPLDHLLFTGATEIGRKVMAAAAEHLTPVTLELGGKSPAIICGTDDLQNAAESIVAGKLFNAGQTCIAPDYVLVPTGMAAEFAETAKQVAAAAYPDFNNNTDYTSIIHQAHYERLLNLLAETATRGAKMVPLFDVPHNAKRRRITPTIVLQPNCELGLMQEEIFGPILPVIEVEDLKSSVEFINQRARPLALYIFGANRVERDWVLDHISAGGVCVNDTLLHIAQLDLPFGGVGDSGIGHYHGWFGFERFSKAQPVYQQSRFSGSKMFRPPFTPWKKTLLRWLSK